MVITKNSPIHINYVDVPLDMVVLEFVVSQVYQVIFSLDRFGLIRKNDLHLKMEYENIHYLKNSNPYLWYIMKIIPNSKGSCYTLHPKSHTHFLHPNVAFSR
jgi:hypothetical protein